MGKLTTGIRQLKNNKKENILFSNGLYEEKQKEAKEKLKTLTLIKNALNSERKVLSFYQPIVCNQTQTIEKYNATKSQDKFI